MALLTYKSYWVDKATVADTACIASLLSSAGADRADQDRLDRKNLKIADYIVKQEHSYVVRDADVVYGVVCLTTDKYVELEYLYSTKKYYNIPIGLLMNYVLNHVFTDVKVVCESVDVTTFKSIVDKLPKPMDCYVVKDSFKKFVKRYEDGR